MAVLRQRKESYRRRQPGIVNLISASEMEQFLENGLVGRLGLPEKVRRERRALARAEAEHFAALIENEPIGVQIGIVPIRCRTRASSCFASPIAKSWRSAPSGSASSRTSESASP